MRLSSAALLEVFTITNHNHTQHGSHNAIPNKDRTMPQPQPMLQVSTGQVVNLASNDVQRFDNFLPALHYVWCPAGPAHPAPIPMPPQAPNPPSPPRCSPLDILIVSCLVILEAPQAQP